MNKKIKSRLKMVVRPVFEVIDFYHYYSLFKNYNGDKKNTSRAHTAAEIRRLIHAIEVSQTLSSGRHSRGLQKIIDLKSLLDKARNHPELKNIVKEGENCIQVFCRNTTLSPYVVGDLCNENGEECQTNELTSTYSNVNSPVFQETFSRIVKSRRSVRKYVPEEIPIDIIIECVKDSLYTPSACNRAPWKVFRILTEEKRRICLEMQNNSASWREDANLLLITVDLQMYKGTREKNAPFIDGGMFAMTLILSLYSRGIDTCPLNLNLPTKSLIKLIKMLGIKSNEVPVMLIAYGKTEGSVLVTKGIKKSYSDVLYSI